ncbi:MAG TPA: twin-arginine translocase subunit TatC [Vicinamibacterales bacterium]|jgi:sec-independent protein translocase protein TatC|nr:twin-arginine translocase subunit TatC [Vicinamibacterales bacterium]
MALVPFPGPGGSGKTSPHDLDPDPDFSTEGNRILRRDPGADGDRDDDEQDDGEAKMSFLEHLDELRKRIIYSAISIFVGFLIAFIFIQQLFDFVMKPLQAGLPAGQHLVYTEPTEAFVLYLTIAGITGAVLALPLVMTQVWLFIAPGLYAHEKKMAIPFVVLSSIFFILGAAFSHYVVFPLTWKFFVSFTSDYLTFMPRIEPAFALYIKMVLAFGLVFQMPTIVLFLARMGVVTAGFLWKHTKYALLIIVIVSAVVTPDGGGVSLVAMSVPLFFLYLFSIGLAWMFGKKAKKETDEEFA